MIAEIPQTARCIDIAGSGSGSGSGEALTSVQRPLRKPGPHEVLIEVAAAGVNRADIKQRRGVYPMPPDAPSVPGLEVSGTVVRVGDAVTRWRIGDEVCALVIGGGYADYCVAPEVQCLRIPHGMPVRDAAALPEAVFTVWTSLFEQAQLAAGESVLIHGGASGIGTTAIQLARALGSRVIVTAGTDVKCEACMRLGAERAINYTTQDFVAAALEFTDGAGVNVILDMIGAPYLERNLDALGMRGRLAYIAYDGGRMASFDIQWLMRRRQMLTGSTLRHRSIEEKGRIAKAVEQQVWPWLDQKLVQPVISNVFPLADAAAAHAWLEGGNNIGKVLLVP